MGSIAIAYAYYISTLQREKSVGQTMKVYISRFPVFLAITMGMSLHNAWAVFRGWLGQQTAFVRTPKFAINNSGDIWKKKKCSVWNSRASKGTGISGKKTNEIIL